MPTKRSCAASSATEAWWRRNPSSPWRAKRDFCTRSIPRRAPRSGQGTDRQQAARDRARHGHRHHRRRDRASRRAAVGARARGRFRAGVPARPAQQRAAGERLMHPRLRRQVESAAAGDLSPQWRKFLEQVDASYSKADAERAVLEESIRALLALLQRAQEKEAGSRANREAKRARAEKAARKLVKQLDKTGLAVLELNRDLTVRSANAAAERLCGAKDLAGRALLSALEPLHATAIS